MSRRKALLSKSLCVMCEGSGRYLREIRRKINGVLKTFPKGQRCECPVGKELTKSPGG